MEILKDVIKLVVVFTILSMGIFSVSVAILAAIVDKETLEQF